MRERLIDTALLAALVLVALVIIWTLFGSSFRRSSLPTSLPQSSAQRTLPSSTDAAPLNSNLSSTQEVSTPLAEQAEDGVVLLGPDSNSASDSSTAASSLEADASSSEAEASSTAGSAETAAADVAVATETADVVSVPEGAFTLERIGFSYVTGGAGACGMTLEPWTHVAVSRDILSQYPCGTAITIQLEEEVAGRTSFSAIVGDTMGASQSRTVNIYVGQDEPALDYGVREGNLVP